MIDYEDTLAEEQQDRLIKMQTMISDPELADKIWPRDQIEEETEEEEIRPVSAEQLELALRENGFLLSDLG